MSTPFTGNFDFLPVAAQLQHGSVPANPSMRDFDDAMTHAINADPFTVNGAASVWHGEAVRWRRGNGGHMDVEAINTATAKRLHAAQQRML